MNLHYVDSSTPIPMISQPEIHADLRQLLGSSMFFTEVNSRDSSEFYDSYNYLIGILTEEDIQSKFCVGYSIVKSSNILASTDISITQSIKEQQIGYTEVLYDFEDSDPAPYITGTATLGGTPGETGNFTRRGYATRRMRLANTLCTLLFGQKLHSSGDPEPSQRKLWNKLVSQGEAEHICDGLYVMK